MRKDETPIIGIIGNFFKRILLLNSDPYLIDARDWVFAPLAHALKWFGVSPIHITYFSLFSGIVSAVSIGLGDTSLGGISLLVSLVADGIDGLLARITNTESAIGAFLDGVCDRYVDLTVSIGLLLFFTTQEERLHIALICVALIGTSVTSYATPHALSLSSNIIKQHIGFFGRPQRILVIVSFLFFPRFTTLGCWMLALFTNVAALHRIMHFCQVLERFDIEHK